ncbi:hypothetical protein EJ08DRAFT_681854 [Tothia fuscella]|uniref:Uncharacterized protein n=1 Tax=Tothia fuscella TaxID=1048955 RepID=A0A9P4NJY0_9PEZI|nr:hypothetical protein EJ08DRAFT_681854 [Tothia fuscella]
MAPFSYQKAKEVLTETEISRIVCIWATHHDQIKVDYDLAAEEFQCKKGGMRFGYSAIIRKLKEKGCAIGEQGDDDDIADKPEERPAIKKGRKRKGVDEDGEEGARGKKSRKVKNKVPEEHEGDSSSAEAEVNMVLKGEDGDEGGV